VSRREVSISELITKEEGVFMKANYSYRIRWAQVNEEHKTVASGVVTGITNNKDILASAFRQNPEMLSATHVQVSYYEI
jgi:hypothetical protein